MRVGPGLVNSKRPKRIFAVLIFGMLLYAVDCVIASIFNYHPEVPWLELGVFAGTPFALTVLCIVGAICYLLFAKDE